MPRGGPRPNSGPKKKKVEVPIEALSRSTEKTRPAASDPSASSSTSELPTEDQLWAKVTALALQGNPIAMKLALEQRERDAKVALLQEQTRNLKLRNQALKHHLEREGLEAEEDSNEFEPTEDPVRKVTPLKAVGQ